MGPDGNGEALNHQSTVSPARLYHTANAPLQPSMQTGAGAQKLLFYSPS